MLVGAPARTTPDNGVFTLPNPGPANKDSNHVVRNNLNHPRSGSAPPAKSGSGASTVSSATHAPAKHVGFEEFEDISNGAISLVYADSARDLDDVVEDVEVSLPNPEHSLSCCSLPRKHVAAPDQS